MTQVGGLASAPAPLAPLGSLSLLSPLHLKLALLACMAASAEAVAEAGAGAVITSTGRVRAAPAIAAVGAIFVGAIVCFFGYRLLRPAIFICGFLAGGLLVALIIEYAFASMSWVALASWIGFIAAGAISGCLVLMMYHVGLFVIGALAGALLAFTLNTSFMYRLYPSQPNVMLVLLIVVLSVVGGVLAWKVERPVIILATSFIGADAIVWGIGYFAGKYPSGADLKRFRHVNGHGDWVYSIPTAWWFYLAALVLLFLAGTFWQFRCSAKNVRYTRTDDTEYQPAETPADRPSARSTEIPVAGHHV